MKKVLVFGAFDGLHPGHIRFIEQARELGDELVVCLAQNNIISNLKNRDPKHGFNARKAKLDNVKLVDSIISGDNELSTYMCLVDAKPDVIAFGYDQHELQVDVEKWLKKENIDIELHTLKAYEPEKYKSSKLRKV